MFVLYIGAIFVIIALKVATVAVQKDKDKEWETPVQLEAASYGIYTLAMFLLMVILRPTNEATRETFSYVEALPTENEEEQEILQDDKDRCFRRRHAGGAQSADHRTSELASLSDIRNQQSIDEEAKQHSIEKANIELQS